MVTAPPSCRAATKPAPAPISALVTWKLPEPTTPKTWRTPSPARTSPTAAAPRISRSPLDEREHPGRAAGAVHDPQRAGDDDRAGRRQPVEVAQLGQPVLAGAVHERVAREHRVERRRG